MTWCLVCLSIVLAPVTYSVAKDEIGAAPRPFLFVAGCVAVVGCALSAADAAVSVAVALTAPLTLVAGVVDGHVRRLPDPAVLPMYPIVGGVVVIAGIASGDADAMLRAAASSAICLTGYGIVCAFTDGLGFGDVKLSGVIGLLTGWVGWSDVLTATFLSLIVGGAHAIVVLATGRRRTEIPFGPAMLIGAGVGVMGFLRAGLHRTDHDGGAVGAHLRGGLTGLGDVVSHGQHGVGAPRFGLFEKTLHRLVAALHQRLRQTAKFTAEDGFQPGADLATKMSRAHGQTEDLTDHPVDPVPGEVVAGHHHDATSGVDPAAVGLERHFVSRSTVV